MFHNYRIIFIWKRNYKRHFHEARNVFFLYVYVYIYIHTYLSVYNKGKMFVQSLCEIRFPFCLRTR